MRIDLTDPTPEEVTAAVKELLGGQAKSAVARDLGVSRETVYRWERGDSVPSLPELVRLSRMAGRAMTITMNRDAHTIEHEVDELKRQIERLHERIDRWHGPEPEEQEPEGDESDSGHTPPLSGV